MLIKALYEKVKKLLRSECPNILVKLVKMSKNNKLSKMKTSRLKKIRMRKQQFLLLYVFVLFSLVVVSPLLFLGLLLIHIFNVKSATRK